MDMSVMEMDGLAMRLGSLIRRADTFGKSKEDILMELEWIVKDIQKSVDAHDRYMEEEYQKSLVGA